MSRIASHPVAPAGVDERALSLWTTKTKSARLVTTEGSFAASRFRRRAVALSNVHCYFVKV